MSHLKKNQFKAISSTIKIRCEQMQIIMVSATMNLIIRKVFYNPASPVIYALFLLFRDGNKDKPECIINAYEQFRQRCNYLTLRNSLSCSVTFSVQKKTLRLSTRKCLRKSLFPYLVPTKFCRCSFSKHCPIIFLY